jgi:hypothetical protein
MFRWLATFLKNSRISTPPDQETPQPPTRPEEMLRTPGRAHYSTLLAFAHTTTLEDFSATVYCPGLVGSAIRDGDLGPREFRSRDILGSSTFHFSPAQISSFLEGVPVEQTIFLLRKEPNKDNPSPPNRYTIGRGKENDIRIVDFAISRSHAVIEFGPKGYTIVDCGSRNGTKVNGKSVYGSTEPLTDRTVITLGRYEFTFLMPDTLHERLRRIPVTP